MLSVKTWTELGISASFILIMSHIAVVEKLFQYKIVFCFLVWPYTNSAEKDVDNIVTFSEFQYCTSLPVQVSLLWTSVHPRNN